MYQMNEDCVEQLQAALEELKGQHKKLTEENEALTIRADGVQVLSRLLDQSRSDVAELRRKLAEKTAENRRLSNSSNEVFGRTSVSGSHDTSEHCLDVSLGSSPWSTHDADAFNEVMSELKVLLDKNKELASELEEALNNHAKLNGDDGVLLESLNILKVQLDKYNCRLQGEGDWPRKLQDEANRLKEKLTDIAAQRGTTCGKLQDEIDTVKQKLLEIEERIASKTVNKQDTVQMDVDDEVSCKPKSSTTFDSDSRPASSMGAQAITGDATGKSNEKLDETPVAKPRTDLKDENERLKLKIDRLEQENGALRSEKEELIKVNHDWDTQYRKLQEYLKKEIKGKDESLQKLQRELSQEHQQAHGSVKELLGHKDATIADQALKIRNLKEELDRVTLEHMVNAQKRVESAIDFKYQNAKRMYFELKKENDLLKRREETAMQETQVLKDAVEVLERETKSLNAKNRTLENDIERLSNMIEFTSGERRTRSPTSSLIFQGGPAYTREHSQASDEQIEVLKQQISVYVEDFNSERQEKEKLLEEVKKMKVRVREAEMEAADCRKQMKIYENDFKMEREEKMRQARRLPIQYEKQRSPSPIREFEEEESRRMREYQENRRKQEFMAEMGGFRRPRVLAHPAYNARGSEQPSTPANQLIEGPPDSDLFFGAHVVRDAGGQSTDESCNSIGRNYGTVPERFRP